MALHDYMTGTDIEFEVTPNPLAAADANLEIAKVNAARRERREEIQKKIDRLKAQREQLQKSLESLRAHSLSRMSDDDVVALAKSRGIRDQDIATWLQARSQMNARKTSAAQTKALEDAAAAEKERTKNELIQSIYDAETAYENAKAKASRPGDEDKATLEADSRAKKNRLDSLKKEFAKYGESWESYTSQQSPQDQQTQTPQIPTENAPSENEGEEIELTDAEKKALGETNVGKFYEPTTKNQEKRALKNKAQEAIRKKREEEERKRKYRKEQLDGVKKDLAIIGIYDATGLARYVKNFNKSEDRNDKAKAGAVARLESFVGSDKEFKDYPSLKALFPESTKK